MQRFEDKKDQINATIQAGHFLQSKEWEGFQESLGREVFRIEDGVLFVKLPLALGKSYFYAVGILDLRLKIYDLRKTAKEHDAVFCKFEPMAESGEFADELLRAGFVKSKKEVQPQKTIVLDLTKSEEELLKAMHQKTRYNIRVAEKKDLRFKIYDFKKEPEAFEQFWQILLKTQERDAFRAHDKKYYKKLLELPFAKLFAAEYENKIVAANIILFYGYVAYYLHGASGYEHRNLMAPYLLHWETIKYAKANGCKEYDFWGIDEQKWPGVTRFKKGFGGREVEYIGSYDYVFKPLWYKLYNMRNRIKAIL